MTKTMTSKERVVCTLYHNEPDTVPIFEFLYSREFFKEVLGGVPDIYNAEAVIECSKKVGYDLCVIPFGGYGGISVMGSDTTVYQDEWQTTYKKDEASWPGDAPIAYPIKDRNDWANYILPDPKLDSRLDGVKTALKLSKETKMAVFGNIRGPFSAACLLLGFENFCMKLYDDPELIDDIMSRITDFYIEGGTRMSELGVDAILFADDYGSSLSPLISPSQFNKHILPQLKRLVDRFKRLGTPIIMHSDGNIRPLLDSIVSAGINGYHPIERAAGMDISEIKQQFGKKLCLIGNINNKTTLVKGTVNDVVEEVRECIKIAAPGGGYILASDHSVHDDIPNENIFAIYEAGRKYGKYPIKLSN